MSVGNLWFKRTVHSNEKMKKGIHDSHWNPLNIRFSKNYENI